MRPDSLLGSAARVVAGPPLALIAVTTLLLWLARAAGLFGLPLALVSLSWVWAYGYLLVVATARGQPLPVLTIESTNPWHEPRPLALLAVVGLALVAGRALAMRLGAPALVGAALVVLLTSPAALALLAVEGDGWRVLSPPALVRVAAGLGTRYLGLLALALGYAALLATLAARLPFVVLAATAQLMWLSVAAALGTSLYVRRNELGLEAWEAPERAATRAAREAERERDAFATEIYGLLRARRGPTAWRHAGEWLARGGRDPDQYRWLRDRALLWGESTFADRLGDELVSRLLALGRRGEALGEIEDCWRRGGRYVADDHRDRDVLEATARELGRTATHARLRAERGTH